MRCFIWGSSPSAPKISFYDGIDSHPYCTAHRAIIWARHYYSAISKLQRLPSSSSTASVCQWSPPPSQWVCLNTDKGVCTATKLAKTSGLLRESYGTWIRGYNHSIGIVDALTVELWAIHDGLIAAWELGFEFVRVQSNCTKAISPLSADNASRDSYALMKSIHSLCQRGWTIDFVWIPREANQATNHLNKNLPLSQFEQVYLDTLLAHLGDLLIRDINGPPYSRGPP
ncbi:hypothetical protein V6N13_110046 [Hibiscus sabdariffa]